MSQQSNPFAAFHWGGELLSFSHGKTVQETWSQFNDAPEDLIEVASRCGGEVRTLLRAALRCVELVLPGYEKAYPGDWRPRAALSGVAAWLDGEPITTEDLRARAKAAGRALHEAEEAYEDAECSVAAGASCAAQLLASWCASLSDPEERTRAETELLANEDFLRCYGVLSTALHHAFSPSEREAAERRELTRQASDIIRGYFPDCPLAR